MPAPPRFRHFTPPRIERVPVEGPRRWIGWALLGAFLLAVAGGLVGFIVYAVRMKPAEVAKVPATPAPVVVPEVKVKPKPKPKPVKTTLGDLVDEFRDNEIRATERWEGAWVTIRVEVTRVSTGLTGTPYVSGRTGAEPRAWHGMFYANTDEARKVSTGAPVAVTGRVKRFGMGMLILENCTFEPTTPDP